MDTDPDQRTSHDPPLSLESISKTLKIVMLGHAPNKQSEVMHHIITKRKRN